MTFRLAIIALGIAAASACTIELIERGDDDDGDPLQDGGPGLPDAAPIDAAAPACGDGVLQPLLGEVCDDGNTFPGDGCSDDCRSDESCGNGVVDFFSDEECDAGGWSATCDADCTLALCGDLVINELAGEECELFTYPDADPCDEMCQRLPFPWD